MTPVVVAGLLALFLALICLTCWHCRHERPAVALNLIGDPEMFVDQKLPLAIAPTAADGSSAPVVDIVWSVSGQLSGASVNTTSSDLLNAELVCDVPAELEVSVEAKALDGSVLTAKLPVKVDARPIIATALNLSAGAPVPRG